MPTHKIRRTSGRDETSQMWQVIQSLCLLVGFSTFDGAGIAGATTAGKLKTANAVSFRIGGQSHAKAATDDLWDLSGEPDTGEDEYRAYWLLLEEDGTAIIDAGEEAASEAEALLVLPPLNDDAAVIGVFVAGPECDFDDAGGLAAQGTVYDGIPEGVRLPGLPGLRYIRPPLIELAGF